MRRRFGVRRLAAAVLKARANSRTPKGQRAGLAAQPGAPIWGGERLYGHGRDLSEAAFISGQERLCYLYEMLLKTAEGHGWELQAWAVFPNHYHFVALSPAGGGSLAEFTRHLHSVTAIAVNRWDRAPSRRVWFQYWDTQLTYQRSYLARLSYVHKNAVHHGFVREPSLYPWGSAGWFTRRAKASFYKNVMGMKVDRVRVADEYTVDPWDV